MPPKFFSISTVATAVTFFYLYASVRSLYNLMYPMNKIDISTFAASKLVKPYWNSDVSDMGIKVYLSSSSAFNPDFIIDEFDFKAKENGNDNVATDRSIPKKANPNEDSILLFEESSETSGSLSGTKSIILTKEGKADADSLETDSSFIFANGWLDSVEKKESAEGDGGVFDVLTSASGEGIESTSIFLSLMKRLSDSVSNVFSPSSEDVENIQVVKKSSLTRTIIPIKESSSIWKKMMKNSTVHIHVILTRGQTNQRISSFSSSYDSLQKASRAHNVLFGDVNLVKHDIPHHIQKPDRRLYLDVFFIIRKYILRNDMQGEAKPWDASYANPKGFELYQSSLKMKENGVAYPYWKPEVSVKLVSDDEFYPVDYFGHSGMDLIQIKKQQGFESGYAYIPGLYVDEIGMTSEKYIPLNDTVSALPLRISFDRNDDTSKEDEGNTFSSGGLSPARWRLLKHLSQALESQMQFGFEQSDIDDVRRLIADTNVTLLLITVLASTLHLLFEFLTFKNEVDFWKHNKDLTGLSVRALFMDFFSQVIILLFLIEQESSLLMTIPTACGCIIAFWKCHRGAGFKVLKANTTDQDDQVALLRIFGYELHATRLRSAKKNAKNNEKDLAVLTQEMDSLSTRTLGKWFILPLVVGYTLFTLIADKHPSWYSWFITSSSSAVYGLGFVIMTPQLFLNHKLKSVAHLPWRVLCYRFLNTFIDDLFAFIIRMPTMARISCFRDDVVFIIYLCQRFMYPVDVSRPVEGGSIESLSVDSKSVITTPTLHSKDKNEIESKKTR